MSSATLPAHATGTRVEDCPGLVLILDDEPLLLRSLERILAGDGHRIVLAASPEEADATLADPELDVVLLDLLLGPTRGLELLERLKLERPEVEVIVITGNASIESAVGCIRLGAFDYLAKPFQDAHRVRTTVRKALERRRLVTRNRELEAELRERGPRFELIGRSPAMRTLQRTIHSLRHNESHVLLHGESGTGKELVARAVHQSSPRAEGPFVPVDCGALPESIIESELFGHEKGAFTGAVGAPGLFRIAAGGTLFLDEIGEISPAVQARLLRALQEKEIRPVGAAKAVTVDLRVLAATHRDLGEMVAQGRFRQDLYYRLNVVRIDIPPLRERREDIPLLTHHFIAKYRGPGSRVTGIEDSALAQLMQGEWAGNVRELENVIESAMALAEGERLQPRDLPRAPRPSAGAGGPGPAGLPLSLDAYEGAALRRALEETGGDATAAAARLGIGRSTLYRKLGKHALQPRR